MMIVRSAIAAAGLLAAGAAAAEPMNADAARRFVVGKHFAYNCFDGTRGSGRIYNDGSVIGTIQVRGSGPVRQAMLPPGTVRVKGQAVCAAVRGMPFEPCFNLDKRDPQSFRGSVSGMGFAYCDFIRRPEHPLHLRTTWRAQPAAPLPIDAASANAASVPAGPASDAAE
jgi:hypothetical protein